MPENFSNGRLIIAIFYFSLFFFFLVFYNLGDRQFQNRAVSHCMYSVRVIPSLSNRRFFAHSLSSVRFAKRAAKFTYFQTARCQAGNISATVRWMATAADARLFRETNRSATMRLDRRRLRCSRIFGQTVSLLLELGFFYTPVYSIMSYSFKIIKLSTNLLEPSDVFIATL